MITKPMLAASCRDMALLDWSHAWLATPKLDGVRCLKVGGKALSRKFLPIGNDFIRNWIESNLPDGVDGELMVKGRTFSQSCGDIGRSDGEPDFVFNIFDYVSDGLAVPYYMRMEYLRRDIVFRDVSRINKILPKRITVLAELNRYEEECLANGFEGVMVRSPESPYKCGRSTAREGYLLKIKRFEDAEAVIVGFEEGLHNGNEAQKDAFGRTKRSTAKDGMVGTGTLGALLLSDAVHFPAGTFSVGFNHLEAGIDAATAWQKRATLVGRTVTYRYQPVGVKDKPRFPTFKGFREAWDLDA